MPADARHLLLALRALDEQDVGAGLGVGLPAPQRLVEPVVSARIRARNDEKVG